jgi:chitodextrinase
MNNKKIFTTLCAGLMLTSLLGLVHAVNPPASPYSTYGYVTINGNPAPAGIEIILSIDGRIDRTDLTNTNGQYTIDFESQPGETATLRVHIGDQFFIPTINPLFHIEHTSPHGYYLNLTISSETIPPVADAGGPYYAQINQPITFSGAESFDLDGTITGYRWDWTNDGTWDTTWLPTPTTTHSYDTLAINTVKLEVQDNSGATDDDTTTATITTEPPQNQPPNTPNNPTPQNNAINQSIFVDLAWNGGDPDTIDTITYEIYFGTTSTPPLYHTTNPYPATQTSITYALLVLEKNTQYYWQINAFDNHGATIIGPLWTFRTVPLGDNQAPSKVTGLIVTDAKDGKLSLIWNPATDNVAVDHYEIYRDNVLIKNQTTTSYQDTGLTNGQTYTYKIRAVDTSGNYGEFSDPASGTPTETPSNPGDTTPPIIPPLKENKLPIADASRGEPYQGFSDQALIFDGTASKDPDGHIISWKWTFGDGINGSGETVSHTYTTPGVYTIVLTVTDNQSAKDTDETTATILKPNHPPTTPTLTGPTSGDITMDYEFTAVSTDSDNDTIQYLFIWDDGQNTTTEFIMNGTNTLQTHQWTAAGKYTIQVKAFDNLTYSGTTEHIIYINTEEVGTIGYLIDENNDATYDLFYSYLIQNTTSVEKQTDGTYLIDNDGDGDWDYVYDPTTKTLTEYTASSEPSVESNNTPLYLILFILLILVGILILILAKRKKPQEQPPQQKPETKTTPIAEEPTKTQKKTTKPRKKK